MKKTPLSIFFALTIFIGQAQEEIDIAHISDSIVADARQLYRSEMASWFGTDVFVEKSKDKSRAKGYFSYALPNATRCIFYSNDSIPVVLGSITFDSTYNVNTAAADFAERNFSDLEKDIFLLRSKAFDIISKDTFFLQYKNTNYNIIPMIMNGERRVYILTGTTQNGEVIFGNDYLLYFNAQNDLENKKRLHNSIIRTAYGAQPDGNDIVGGMHTHVLDDFITATDICTLMLYGKLLHWKQYTVASQKYFSFWNCESNSLVIITKEAVERINKDQQKRRKKRD